MITYYTTFGLNIASELELPLPKGDSEVFDIKIEKGAVPKELESSLFNGLCFQQNERELLLEIESIARFWIRDGRIITVQPANQNTTDQDISVFILGSALSAALEQRGLCCLHASAIEYKEQAYLFMGQSGAGKSTISAALAQKGFNLLSDDVCPLEIIDNSLHVQPGYPLSKLWPDSLKKLLIKEQELPKIREGLSKRRFSWKDSVYRSPLPVAKLFLLAPSTNSEIEITQLTPVEALATCKHQRYRPQLHKFPSQQIAHFKTLSHIANHTPVLQINRPKHTFALNHLVNKVVNFLET